MSGVVRFRAELADGRVVVGSIQGNGGELGNASLCQGTRAARAHAIRRMRAIQRCAAEGLSVSIYEPAPGCVAMFPDWSLESRGEVVAVPLLGTRFTLARERT